MLNSSHENMCGSSNFRVPCWIFLVWVILLLNFRWASKQTMQAFSARSFQNYPHTWKNGASQVKKQKHQRSGHAIPRGILQQRTFDYRCHLIMNKDANCMFISHWISWTFQIHISLKLLGYWKICPGTQKIHDLF